MYKLFFVILYYLILFKNVTASKSSNTANSHRKLPGFLLLFPKTLVTGKNETVCLSLHRLDLPARVLIDLKWKEKHFTTSKSLDLENTCFQIYVPTKIIFEPQFVSIKAQVQIKNETYSAHNQDPILIYPNKLGKIFIETDRAVYKPGDTVKLRVLLLNDDFLPLSAQVTRIKIRNPMGITVMLWDNINSDHGLVSLEYPLVAEAMTGKWKIEVQNQVKNFEVSKYVLPRFKIELKHPKAVYIKHTGILISVCAKYSYNKPVPGIAFIKVTDSHNNMKPVNRLQEMSNGCSEFELNQDELNLLNIHEKYNYDPKIIIFITATVTEHGTNKIDVATGKTQVVLKGYSLKFRSNPIFIPGIPYRGHLKLANNITSTCEEVIKICYNLAIKKSWNYFKQEECQNYTIPHDGVINFKLWPFKTNVVHVHLHARSLNNTIIENSALLVRMYSSSNSFIYLEKEDTVHQFCDTLYQYKAVYMTDGFRDGDNITFYYMIKTNGDIFKLEKIVHVVKKTKSNYLDGANYLGKRHKFVKSVGSVDETFIKFKIDRKFVSKFKLVVYYVTDDGETIVATKTEEVKPCTLKVESSWNQDHLVPGEVATLNIKSESPALCAISATDQSSKFLSSNNNFNIERILKAVSQERDGARSGRNACILNYRKNQADPVSNPIWDSQRSKRHVYSFSEDYDSYDIFSRSGIITITNLKVITKHCYNGPLLNDTKDNSTIDNFVRVKKTGPQMELDSKKWSSVCIFPHKMPIFATRVQFMTDQYNTDNEDGSQITIRSFFPENWLWELVPVSDSVQIQREVPHSITNWVTNVYCVSKTEGIGFSQDIGLLSFQPFFVQVLTPYSLKKGEFSNLQIHVFNYLNFTFPITISIRLSTNLKLAALYQLSAIYCLEENSTVTHTYPLASLETGLANVTVLVETENQYPLDCGPEIIISKRDVVFKSILIEPEGFLVTKTKSALLCSPSDTANNVTWNLIFPADLVVGTEKSIFTVNTDLLGCTIQNLNQLLTMPAGCGEQIMASMAPNLYVLQYLNATGHLTPSIRQQIMRNLKMGYQRILNYVHVDGSFSAFGYYDSSGSMFLTAFVVKILQEAAHFIYVDQRVVGKAVSWIFSHQLENGCFDTMDHVFQDMGGTNMENSTAGLTAYVIISLFNAKVDVPDTVQTNAKYCIRSQHNPDKYSLIISCYALFKVHWISEANRFLEKCISLSNRENDMMWWSAKSDDEYYASDIEMTSYALLALMQQKTAENMAFAHSIVQWLTSKIGPNGGFKSTQDTAVALEALTTYFKYIHTNEPDIKLNLESHQKKQVFTINESDRLKSIQVYLPNQNSEVKIDVTGTGCALAQQTISYYSTNDSKSEAFILAVDVAPVSNIDQFSIKSITSCVAYQGPEKLSNMAVMELSLPSGYEADRTSLNSLLDTERQRSIKMVEEKDSQVNFYFTKLDQHQVCFSFFINEQLPLENRKKSLIKLYDYYRPEQNILKFYEVINNNCSNILIGLEKKANLTFMPGINEMLNQENASFAHKIDHNT